MGGSAGGLWWAVRFRVVEVRVLGPVDWSMALLWSGCRRRSGRCWPLWRRGWMSGCRSTCWSRRCGRRCRRRRRASRCRATSSACGVRSGRRRSSSVPVGTGSIPVTSTLMRRGLPRLLEQARSARSGVVTSTSRSGCWMMPVRCSAASRMRMWRRGPLPAGEVQRLVELRAAIIEESAEAELARRRGVSRCVGELEALVQANPYREGRGRC